MTQTERDQLKQGRPDESKESYALVYEKDALPNTGQSQSIMTVFGLLTIGSLVVVITKDKRNKKNSYIFDCRGDRFSYTINCFST